MSRHTPGPWTSSGTQVCTWDKNNYANNVPFTYDPPLPGASRQWTEKLLEEAKANARLIAAAPEMLEALERIIHAPLCELQDRIVRAREVVAKAKGEK